MSIIAAPPHRYIQTMEMLRGWNGVDFLDRSLTINSQTVTPIFVYLGGDADATELLADGFGNDLPRVNVGVQPSYNDGSPYFSVNDDSFKGNASDYYQDAGTAFGNIGTDDFKYEIVFKTPASAIINGVIAKDSAVMGYRANYFLDSKFYFVLDDGADLTLVASSVLAFSTWYHIIIFADRSGNIRLYVNGVFDQTADISLSDSTLDETSSFTIAARTDGTNPYSSNIAYQAMWKSATLCSGTTAEQDDIAQERFEKLSGFNAQFAEGTSGTIVRTRSTPAYLRKLESGEIKLYKVGANAARMSYIKDKNDDDMKGYEAEEAATNICLDNRNFAPATTAWAENTGGDTQDLNSVIAPDGTLTADGMIASGALTGHGLNQDINLANSTYVFSCFMKPGDENWVLLQNGGIANGFAFFNIATGVIGTVGAGTIEAFIEGPFLNGFYRCGISFASGGAGIDTFFIQTAEGDSDAVFSGDGATVNTYFWSAQLELGAYMTSPVDTEGIDVTKTADVVIYKADDGNIGGVGSDREGTLELKFLIPDYDLTANLRLFTLSDGGTSADFIAAYVRTISEMIYYDIRATAGVAGDVDAGGSLADGVIHTARFTWKENKMQMYIDDVLVGTDTSVSIPDNLDRYNVGSQWDNTTQFKHLISDVKIFKEFTS